jgi:hypothetical protein
MLMGLGSIVLAYCNSAGRPRLLIWHYLGMFVTGAAVLGAIYIAEGRHISITQLALALTVGQAFAVITAVILVAREKGGARGTARALVVESASAKAQ